MVSTRRCTSIGLKEDARVTVHTIEHFMAALWGSDIDNILVEIDNAETPVADGSALTYMELIKEAGIKELPEERFIKRIEEPIWAKKLICI